MANPNISEIITTTIQSRSRKLADDVTKNNAILLRLGDKGKIKTVTGGDVILQEMQYAENQNFKYYSGYETLNIQPNDTFTSASFDWKQAAVAVTISGLEQLKNGGKEQMIDLLEARIENAEATMRNNISIGMYGDGTGSGGKAIGGLQLLVADAPSSGVVGGIDRATWTFWRNIKFSSTTDGGGAATNANIQSYMNRTWLQVVRGRDKPDLIVADNNYFRLYWESLQAIQRITSEANSMAAAGFESLKYQSADVVFDGGIGGGAPSNHMYFLNTNYLFFRPHKDRYFVPLGGDRFVSTNQDAVLKLIVFAGNMTASNCSLQAALIN